MGALSESRGGAETRRKREIHAETQRRRGGMFAAEPLSLSCGAFDAISEYLMAPSVQSDIFAPLRLCVLKNLPSSASPRLRVSPPLERAVQ